MHGPSIVRALIATVLLGAATPAAAQISLAGYPDVLRRGLEIPDEMEIIRGLSIGYPDDEFPANHVKVGRDPIENNVVFIHE